MLAKEAPEFIAKCAAYARCDQDIEFGRYKVLATKNKMNAETVTIHLLLRLLLNAK